VPYSSRDSVVIQRSPKVFFAIGIEQKEAQRVNRYLKVATLDAESKEG
jgi:hypothetical protein